MCRVCEQQKKMVTALASNQECVYTVSALQEALKHSSDAYLSSLLKSQINVYNHNCNQYVDRITKRLQELGVPVI